MGTISRGPKAAGGMAFVPLTTALASEVNTDFDTAYNEINGNLDNANVKAAAAIAETKVAANSGASTVASPGDTSAPVAASDLDTEIHRLRYKLQELTIGIQVSYMNAAGAAVAAAWQEAPALGPNLIRGGGFASQTNGIDTPPDGWDFVTNSLNASTGLTVSGTATYGQVSFVGSPGIVAGDLITLTKASNPTQVRWVESVSGAAPQTVRVTKAFDVTGIDSTWTAGFQTVRSTCAVQATAAADDLGGDFEVTITAGTAAQEGISQTLSGVRADTKYLVGVWCQGNTNDAILKTTGGISGAAYQNLSLASASASYAMLAGIVKTDSSGTALVVQLLTEGASSDQATFTRAFCHEIQTHRAPPTPGAVAVASFPDEVTLSNGVSWTNITRTSTAAWSASIRVPGPGYRIRVCARASISSTTNAVFFFRIAESDGTNTRIIASGSNARADASTFQAPIVLDGVNASPTGGTTYTYTVQYDSTGVGAGTFQIEGAAAPGILMVELVRPG